MTSKDELKQLIDELPEGKADTARALLVSLLRGDALDRAPMDDEPDTDEERAAAQAGWEAYQRGESISSAEARRRLLG